MSIDPKNQARPLRVVGAETAPSGYVDYPYWAIHPTGPDGSHPLVSLTMGRWVEIPPDIAAPKNEPGLAKRQVSVAFIATLAPDTLRLIRDGIDRVLAAIERKGKPEDPTSSTVH